MSLERADVRARIDADVHTALLLLCTVDGVTVAEFIERLLVPVVCQRVRVAIELHKQIENMGIPATTWDR